MVHSVEDITEIDLHQCAYFPEVFRSHNFTLALDPSHCIATRQRAANEYNNILHAYSWWSKKKTAITIIIIVITVKMEDHGFFYQGHLTRTFWPFQVIGLLFCIINPDKITYVVEQHIVTKKLVNLQVIKIARVKIKFPSDNKIQEFLPLFTVAKFSENPAFPELRAPCEWVIWHNPVGYSHLEQFWRLICDDEIK